MPSRREEKEEARAQRLATADEQARSDERRKRIATLMAAIALAAAVVVAVVLVSGGEDEDEAPAPGLLRGVPQEGIALGDPDAPVTLVEFADLQCPFCAQFSGETFPQLVDRYVRPGDLRMELRLLSFLGPDSVRGAEVAAATAQQDRYWSFAEAFFNNQRGENTGYVDEEFLREIMDNIPGLDAERALEEAGTEPSIRLLEEADELARERNVDSTPSFLIGPTGGELRLMEIAGLETQVFADAIRDELERTGD